MNPLLFLEKKKVLGSLGAGGAQGRSCQKESQWKCTKRQSERSEDIFVLLHNFTKGIYTTGPLKY